MSNTAISPMQELIERLESLHNRYTDAGIMTAIGIAKELLSTPTPDEQTKAGQEGGWKVIPHSYQIADTGDYDGHYELTNGKVSLFTKDEAYNDDEPFAEIIKALNQSGASFYIEDDKGYLSFLQSECARLEKQLNTPTPTQVDLDNMAVAANEYRRMLEGKGYEDGFFSYESIYESFKAGAQWQANQPVQREPELKWVKVKTEDDLPKASGYYYVKIGPLKDKILWTKTELEKRFKYDNKIEIEWLDETEPVQPAKEQEPLSKIQVDYYEDKIEAMHKSYSAIFKELEVTEQLLNDRQKLLDAIPECPVHGKCVPHALQWIENAKKQQP